ncbi:hypothetical protein BDK51DRAFT_32611 [Blyttiomyces helicus]|uniref:Uncharacterized protein n=1 Tax=Blyttiomyces helicus TaxID=388810 RepID=A0A4V1IPG1_9FUNG|nr:hypothetical protein BDK51DRAFT_32611 [Blyttiomyces helicus]|eukprot:RKO82937.1 hypothetical protein BDK51DRAFT_32611 [Blyttiomyces helicus]
MNSPTLLSWILQMCVALFPVFVVLLFGLFTLYITQHTCDGVMPQVVDGGDLVSELVESVHHPQIWPITRPSNFDLRIQKHLAHTFEASLKEDKTPNGVGREAFECDRVDQRSNNERWNTGGVKEFGTGRNLVDRWNSGFWNNKPRDAKRDLPLATRVPRVSP